VNTSGRRARLRWRVGRTGHALEIDRPAEGELTVLGMPITAGREIRRRMGVVPQENNLEEDLSVLENLVVYAILVE
jgi:ABC-type multidrug transport system ATPase subunit